MPWARTNNGIGCRGPTSASYVPPPITPAVAAAAVDDSYSSASGAITRPPHWRARYAATVAASIRNGAGMRVSTE